MAAGNDDDRGMAGGAVAAENLVEGGTVEVGEADVEEDEMGLQLWYGVAGKLSVGEEGKLPVDVFFEGVEKEVGELGVVFDNSDEFCEWC